MCLYIKVNSRQRIASKDIVCYKFVETEPTVNADGDIVLGDTRKSPYYYHKVKLGNTYESALKRVVPVDKSIAYIRNGLHSFCNVDDAMRTINYFCYITHRVEIIECIIPKGSKYFKGTTEILDGRSGNGYASDKITYTNNILYSNL